MLMSKVFGPRVVCCCGFVVTQALQRPAAREEGKASHRGAGICQFTVFNGLDCFCERLQPFLQALVFSLIWFGLDNQRQALRA